MAIVMKKLLLVGDSNYRVVLRFQVREDLISPCYFCGREGAALRAHLQEVRWGRMRISSDDIWSRIRTELYARGWDWRSVCVACYDQFIRRVREGTAPRRP